MEGPSNCHPPTKAHSLEDILLQLGPITGVSFEPFQPEQPRQPARAVLPPSFPQTSKPFDYFSLFFTPDLFRIITTNTNQYANIQRLHKEEGIREWTDLLLEELYVFIGVIIYMGVHEEPQMKMYWNTDSNKGPLHSITNHISLNRFEDIKRYCHISNSESDQAQGFHLPSNKIWWYKLKPLALSIQASCQRYYSPSSEVSIDELMVRFFGR
jgi:hypothetical protein